MQRENQKRLVTFNIQYRCNYGDSVYVVLSTKKDERMSLESAIRLKCQNGDHWSKTVDIEVDGSVLRFHYKYIVAPTDINAKGFIRWEQGLRRCFRADNAVNQQFIIDDRWQHQKIKILLKDFFGPKQRRRKSIGILSHVLNLHENTTELTLESYKENPIGEYWTSDVYWIPLTEERIGLYAYFIRASKKLIIKNRRVDLKYLLNPDKMLENLQQGIQISENNIMIVEHLQYEQFIFSEINPRLILGSCINNSKEEDYLLDANCSAIMSLETSKDRRRYKRSGKLLVHEGSIPKYNFPIEDYPKSLILRAVKGAHCLKLLVETHKRVYVHCTYGAFRSVHVVIAYLHLYEGLELSQAIEIVQNARSQANIREDVCTKMFLNLENESPKTKNRNFQTFLWKKKSDPCYREI